MQSKGNNRVKPFLLQDTRRSQDEKQVLLAKTTAELLKQLHHKEEFLTLSFDFPFTEFQETITYISKQSAM